MVPGLDKLEKDYAEIDTDKKKNTNIPINPVIITNPADINVSYINSYKREKRTDPFPLTYDERFSKITSKGDIINTLQNLKSHEDIASYLNGTLRYDPMVKEINVSYDTFPTDTSEVRASVSIALIDNTNIYCDLSLYY